MIIRTLLPALFLAGFVSSSTMANADDLKTAVNPGHLADTAEFGYSRATISSPKAKVSHVAGQIGITGDGANDIESQFARSFNNLISVVEAEGGSIEDLVKITLVVKYHDEIEPRYLVQTSPGSWRAYRQTR